MYSYMADFEEESEFNHEQNWHQIYWVLILNSIPVHWI